VEQTLVPRDPMRSRLVVKLPATNIPSCGFKAATAVSAKPGAAATIRSRRAVDWIRLLSPALSSFEEERENYSVLRFTQGGADFVWLALGYILSGCQPLRIKFGALEHYH